MYRIKYEINKICQFIILYLFFIGRGPKRQFSRDISNFEAF